MRITGNRLSSTHTEVCIGRGGYSPGRAREIAREILRVADEIDARNERERNEYVAQLRIECDDQRELSV